MASGKSTIGVRLAEILGFKFMDLDAYIEQKEGLDIKEIFKKNGEIYFRKVEHICLKEILNNKENYVLALGGGTPSYANNMKLISDSKAWMSIYLKASIKTLVDRLYSEKEHRPLVERLKTKEELTEFIGKHLFERNFYYNQADYSVVIDKKSEEEIQEQILFHLYQ